jgi:hypothetical protein
MGTTNVKKPNYSEDFEELNGGAETDPSNEHPFMFNVQRKEEPYLV